MNPKISADHLKRRAIVYIHQRVRKDPDKRWRYVRIPSVATALLSEALWTNRIHRERQERAEREDRQE